MLKFASMLAALMDLMERLLKQNAPPEEISICLLAIQAQVAREAKATTSKSPQNSVVPMSSDWIHGLPESQHITR
jgi:hypothetical protein